MSGYTVQDHLNKTLIGEEALHQKISHTQHRREMRKVPRVCSFLVLMFLSTLAESRRGPGEAYGGGASRSEKVVISSTGGAAQHQGGLLGQFEYLEDKDYYLQSNTEQSNEQFIAVYLYPDEDDDRNEAGSTTASPAKHRPQLAGCLMMAGHGIMTRV